MTPPKKIKNLFLEIACSLLICSIIVYCQFKIQSVVPGRNVFIYPALLIISWIAGFIPALICIIYCSALALFLYSADPISPTLPEAIKITTFILSATTMAAIMAYSKKSENKLKDHLRQHADELKLLADSIPHIIWTANAEGVQNFYNARFFEFSGKSPEDGILQSWESIIHPDDYKRALPLWNECLKTGRPYNIEYRLLDNNTKNYRWFLGRAMPVVNSQGQIVKWFGSCTDIDDQLVLSAKMEKINLELEKALHARDEFLSIASHELKTPLTTLRLHTQQFIRNAARNSPDAYSKKRTDLLTAQIERQTFKLNRLIDDMLDISRIRTGQFSLKPQEFNLGEFIDDISIELKNYLFASKNPVPAIYHDCQAITVAWDKVRIEQAILNLFTNAIRYGEGKQIIFTTHLKEETVIFKVKDHGIGIAEEDQEKIFYRFEKIRSSEINGLGLGLFITKQIIVAHQGNIKVSSCPGNGSEFTVELPKHLTP